jgi:hypothetical protein
VGNDGYWDKYGASAYGQKPSVWQGLKFSQYLSFKFQITDLCVSRGNTDPYVSNGYGSRIAADEKP